MLRTRTAFRPMKTSRDLVVNFGTRVAMSTTHMRVEEACLSSDRSSIIIVKFSLQDRVCEAVQHLEVKESEMSEVG